MATKEIRRESTREGLQAGGQAALAGAGTGAAIGAFGGPLGILIGAGVGAVAGFAAGYIPGKVGSKKRLLGEEAFGKKQAKVAEKAAITKRLGQGKSLAAAARARSRAKGGVRYGPDDRELIGATVAGGAGSTDKTIAEIRGVTAKIA